MLFSSAQVVSVTLKAPSSSADLDTRDTMTATGCPFIDWSGVNLDPENIQTSGHDNVADAMHVCDMILRQYIDGFQ